MAATTVLATNVLDDITSGEGPITGGPDKKALGVAGGTAGALLSEAVTNSLRANVNRQKSRKRTGDGVAADGPERLDGAIAAGDHRHRERCVAKLTFLLASTTTLVGAAPTDEVAGLDGPGVMVSDAEPKYAVSVACGASVV